MEKTELRNFNVDNNCLIFKHGQLETTITPILLGDNINFFLNVYDKTHNKDFRLYFCSLEHAIIFVQNVVSKSKNIGDVINVYSEMIRSNDEAHTMYFSETRVLGIISNYFCSGKQYKTMPYKKLYLENGEPKVRFYIREEYAKGIQHDNPLTEHDLISALNDYLKKFNCEVDHFEYVGGVHHVGYYYDEDTPYFEGLNVYTKDLEKSNEYSLSMKQKSEK